MGSEAETRPSLRDLVDAVFHPAELMMGIVRAGFRSTTKRSRLRELLADVRSAGDALEAELDRRER